MRRPTRPPVVRHGNPNSPGPREWIELERAPELDDGDHWAYAWRKARLGRQPTGWGSEGVILVTRDGRTFVRPRWEPGTPEGLSGVPSITAQIVIGRHVRETGQRPERYRWVQPELPPLRRPVPIQQRSTQESGLGLGNLGERARRRPG